MEDKESLLSSALETKSSANADPTAAQAEMDEAGEVKFNARVPGRLRDAFQKVCKSEGRSRSWVVREWMRRAVRNEETGL